MHTSPMMLSCHGTSHPHFLSLSLPLSPSALLSLHHLLAPACVSGVGCQANSSVMHPSKCYSHNLAKQLLWNLRDKISFLKLSWYLQSFHFSSHQKISLSLSSSRGVGIFMCACLLMQKKRCHYRYNENHSKTWPRRNSHNLVRAVIKSFTWKNKNTT